DILACLIGIFLYRLPLYPIVNGFYGSILSKLAWLPPLHTLGYYLNCLSQNLGVLMAYNRFSGLFRPQYHDKIWKYALFVGIPACFTAAAYPVWFLFGYPVEFKLIENYTDFRLYGLEVDWIPQTTIWYNMAFVTVVCNGVSSLIYVACLIRLCFFTTWRNSTIERNLFLVGLTSMLFSIPYMIAMLPWLTDLKYLSLAPMLLLTNSSIRSSIKKIFCS
ncbi:hypothetical protein PMAYCL1PPCAC_32843, partial [Pristionchus mayeri]